MKHTPAVTVPVSRVCRVKRDVGVPDPYLCRGAVCDCCGRVFDHDGVSPLSIAARACLDRKRAKHVSRRVFRLRFKRVSLRAFASVVVDDTSVIPAEPSDSNVSGILLQNSPSVHDNQLNIHSDCQV